MKPSELPKFITRGKKLPAAKKRAPNRRRSVSRVLNVQGDTGTPEAKKRQTVILEVRDRSSTGHATAVGARVEAQLPHDRYRVRNLLDPKTPWKNERFWDARGGWANSDRSISGKSA
jgi:hypothetical protein